MTLIIKVFDNEINKCIILIFHSAQSLKDL